MGGQHEGEMGLVSQATTTSCKPEMQLSPLITPAKVYVYDILQLETAIRVSLRICWWLGLNKKQIAGGGVLLCTPERTKRITTTTKSAHNVTCDVSNPSAPAPTTTSSTVSVLWKATGQLHPGRWEE